MTLQLEKQSISIIEQMNNIILLSAFAVDKMDAQTLNPNVMSPLSKEHKRVPLHSPKSIEIRFYIYQFKGTIT